MTVYDDINKWRTDRLLLPPLGFVPTMGALHAGHLRLVDESRAHNAETVVSLFVNPTQFDDPQDLRAYPQDLEGDLRLLEEAGVEHVLTPRAEAMYPQGYRYKVTETEDSRRLCGAHRAGHFEGMLTVVLKLLLLVRPQRAYFGEKDFQQLRLVQGMVADFFVDTEIVPVPIVREADGLAMSSRNARLSPEARTQAALFPRLLATPGTAEQVKESLIQAGFEVDYVEDWQGRRLAAVRVASKGGSVRLIDNLS